MNAPPLTRADRHRLDRLAEMRRYIEHAREARDEAARYWDLAATSWLVRREFDHALQLLELGWRYVLHARYYLSEARAALHESRRPPTKKTCCTWSETGRDLCALPEGHEGGHDFERRVA